MQYVVDDQQIKDQTLAGVSRPAGLVSAFAGISMLLAGIGVYGVIAYSVTQRRKELGIRVALGASAGNVFADVLQNALAMVAFGLAAGLVGSYGLTRILKSFLFEVSPLDPLSLLMASFSLLAIGIVAGLVPALRASRLNPMKSLREEG